MKGISKILFISLISLFSISNAIASEPSYSKEPTKNKNAKYSEVFLTNKVYEGFSVSAVYPNSRRIYNMPLNPAGTYQDAIKYPIDSPDTSVCLDVSQNATGNRVFYGCLESGQFNIRYSVDNRTIIVTTY